MSHSWNCHCVRCERESARELTILGVLPSPPTPQEEADARLNGYVDAVVLPGLRVNG